MRSHTVPSNNRATIKASRNAPIFFRRAREKAHLCLLRTVRKPFRVILCTPCVDTFRVPKRLAFKARVLLTFRTPLASNRLRHFFNAQATQQQQQQQQEEAQEASRQKSRKRTSRLARPKVGSRLARRTRIDVKKEKQIQSFFFFVPGRSEIHTSRETKDNKQTKIVVTPKYIHHRALERALHPRGGVVLSRFFGFGFSRRARVRAFSSRLLFSRRMVQKKEL